MPKKKQSSNLAIVIVLAAAIIIGVYILSQSLNLSTIQNIFQSDSQPQPPPDYQPPDYQPAENSLVPTSLSVQVSPNPANMGGAVYGTVTSNGYNYPITVYARNLGAEEWTNQGTQSFGAFLGADGKYTHLQQVNIPGYWEFWATTSSVTSKKASLTVLGILVSGSRTSVSSGDAYVTFTIFSNFKNTPVSLVAYDPVTYVSIPLQNVNTDDTGSVAVGYNFNAFAVGSYEIDAIIAGQKASTYGGSTWLTVT